jgi:hypothetical protein
MNITALDGTVALITVGESCSPAERRALGGLSEP